MNTFNDETIRNLQSMYNQQQYYGMVGQSNYYELWRKAEVALERQKNLNADLIVKIAKLESKLKNIKAALAARQKARDEIIGELEGI